MKIFQFALVLILAAGCNSTQQNNESPIVSSILAKTTNTSNECEKLDVLDLEMQRLVAEIKVKYRAEDLFEKRFEMSQVYWIQYRDRHVRAIYPQDWNTYYRKEFSKEVFNECKCMEHNRLTLNRIKELAFYLEENDEKGDCPAIWNQ